MNSIDVFGFAGSLRTESYNRALLDACVEYAPPGMNIETLELNDVPLYNGDVEAKGDPKPVTALKDGIEAADGLLIVTPEYNHGVPAVTKNAVDWASRSTNRASDSSPISGKPTAIAGVTPGGWGTIRSQEQLRQSLNAAGAVTLLKPEVLVRSAGDKFEDRELTDENTIEFLEKFLGAFRDWINTVG